MFQPTVFVAQLQVLDQFVHHFTYRRALRECVDAAGNEVPAFWTYTSDAHLLCAIAAWCMVFGADNENNATHWKLVFENDAALVASFRQALQEELGLTLDAWRDYHRDMVAFRNNYVSHRAVHPPAVPNLDVARDVVLLYDRWVRDVALANDNFAYPLLRDDAAQMMDDNRVYLGHVMTSVRALRLPAQPV